MTDSVDPRRNIVLVTVDSLRADYSYGDGIATPTLDALADGGTRFETAIAPGPATYESMPAIFTGLQPGPTGARGGVSKRDRIATHLYAHRPLPARLQERAYTTVGVTPNPFTSRQFGFDAGFDRFVDFFDASDSGFSGGLRRRIISRWAQGEFVGGLRFLTNMLGLGDVSVTCSDVVSRAVSALEGVEEPFFLWLMLLDPHWPYRPPRRYRDGAGLVERYRANWRASNLSDVTPTADDTETLRQLYRGTVRAVDDCLGSLSRQLAEHDPVFVIHADHGEAFGEHGRFGHGGLLYEENIRVPLIIGDIGDGTTIWEPTSLRSIPTMLAAISDGQTDPRAFHRGWPYAVSERGDLCIRGPGWKYYLREDGPPRLYDLRTDPDEQAGTETEIHGLAARYESRLRETTRLETATREGVNIERL
jgi:arylsulfatase